MNPKPRRLAFQHDTLDTPTNDPNYAQIEERDLNGDLRLAGFEDQLAEGNLISSQTDVVGAHMPCIDIDVPCRLVPSSTPGHYHLYFDVLVHSDEYFGMLEAMADAGIVEDGYVRASEARGMSLVRRPGVTKPAALDAEPF